MSPAAKSPGLLEATKRAIAPVFSWISGLVAPTTSPQAPTIPCSSRTAPSQPHHISVTNDNDNNDKSNEQLSTPSSAAVTDSTSPALSLSARERSLSAPYEDEIPVASTIEKITAAAAVAAGQPFQNGDETSTSRVVTVKGSIPLARQNVNKTIGLHDSASKSVIPASVSSSPSGGVISEEAPNGQLQQGIEVSTSFETKDMADVTVEETANTTTKNATTIPKDGLVRTATGLVDSTASSVTIPTPLEEDEEAPSMTFTATIDAREDDTQQRTPPATTESTAPRQSFLPVDSSNSNCYNKKNSINNTKSRYAATTTARLGELHTLTSIFQRARIRGNQNNNNNNNIKRSTSKTASSSTKTVVAVLDIGATGGLNIDDSYYDYDYSHGTYNTFDDNDNCDDDNNNEISDAMNMQTLLRERNQELLQVVLCPSSCDVPNRKSGDSKKPTKLGKMKSSPSPSNEETVDLSSAPSLLSSSSSSRDGNESSDFTDTTTTPSTRAKADTTTTTSNGGNSKNGRNRNYTRKRKAEKQAVP